MPINSAITQRISKEIEKIKKNRKDLTVIYEDYKSKCSEANVLPFVPQEQGEFSQYRFIIMSDDLFNIKLNTKLNTKVTPIIFSMQPYEFELDKAWRNLEGSPVASEVHPLKILDVNNYLSGKYMGYVTRYFQESNAANELDPNLQTLLQKINEKDGFRIFVDPSMLQVFMGMLNPFTVSCNQLGNEAWRLQHFLPEENGSILIKLLASGNKKGKLALNNKFLEDLQNRYNVLQNQMNWDHAMAMMVQGSPHNKTVYDTILDNLNKTFLINGYQLYILPKDSKAMASHMNDWFNFSRQLYQAELNHWDIEAPILENLLKRYEVAINKLEAKDNKMYASVSLEEDCIMLNQTTKKANMEERKDLRTLIDEHIESFKKRFSAYEDIKDYLPTMRQALEWLDSVLDLLKKKGKMS